MFGLLKMFFDEDDIFASLATPPESGVIDALLGNLSPLSQLAASGQPEASGQQEAPGQPKDNQKPSTSQSAALVNPPRNPENEPSGKNVVFNIKL